MKQPFRLVAFGALLFALMAYRVFPVAGQGAVYSPGNVLTSQAALPGTCTVGSLVITTATPGLFHCTATNVFTQVSGTGSASAVISKPAITSRQSTTNPTNDPDLLFSVGTNQRWFVEVYLVLTATSINPGYKFKWSLPAGATVTWGAASGFDAATQQWTVRNTGTPQQLLVAASTMTVTSLNQTGAGILLATITTAGTAGTVNFQWAQATSFANDVGLDAGSLLRTTRLN